MLASFKIKRNGPSIACTAVAIVACNALGGCQPQIHQPPQAMQVTDADSIASMIDTTLQYNRSRRVLSVDRNAAWQVAHGAVAYGKDLKLQVEGKEVSALDYLFQGGQMRGWELSTGPVLASTKRPSVQAYVEAGSYVGQGHVDQFLGYLSQAALPLDTPIQIEDQTLTLEDWGRSAQNELPNNPYREYSWTLIALTNLFPNGSGVRGQAGYSRESLWRYASTHGLGPYGSLLQESTDPFPRWMVSGQAGCRASDRDD